MKANKKAAAVAIAAVLACGTIAGCDSLTVRNLTEDYNQVVATVDISGSAAFEADGTFAGLKEIIDESEVSKRQLVLSFISNGATLVQYYGMSVSEVFEYLLDSLIQRQVNVQYAKAYLAKNGDADGAGYDVTGYQNAIGAAGADASAARKKAAGLAYFLTEAEQQKALYDLRVSINGAIDSLEEGLIKYTEEHDHTADSDVRTLPTGAETTSEDFYDTSYRIYTGRETSLGSYEKLKKSTAATRKSAYDQYVSNLYGGDQLRKGEDATKIESTDYFAQQLITQYESALLNKLTDKFEQEAALNLGENWTTEQYNEMLKNQRAEYSEDKSAFEKAFNGVSNSSFVLAPYNYEYGYVLNILLPFSALQSEELKNSSNDLDDENGATYAMRARLLKAVKGTDQRDTWFTGHNDYSYKATEGYGINSGRSYLFFENSVLKTEDVKDEAGSVIKPAQYKKIENYLGLYTYNGTVEFDEDGDAETFTPERLTIDGFLAEMKGYMAYADEKLAFVEDTSVNYKNGYFTRENFYKADGAVDYEQFIYEVGKVGYFNNNKFNPNQMFVKGTPENTAFSVINELSFAYNTDTAGLNSYLGYMISPYTTSYMKEFEYAAQLAVRGGAGTYVVVPTDYGWHIIYCTFSFADIEEGAAAFVFDQSQAQGGENETENSFSWFFFEAIKSKVVDAEVSSRQSDIAAEFGDECSEIYKSVYADLLKLA